LFALCIAASAWAGSFASKEVSTDVAAGAGDWESMQRGWIESIYRSTSPGAVWFTPAGVRPAVAVALRELRAAEQRGLAATDYDAERLEREMAAAARPDRSLADVARADVAMTYAVLHFLSDLRFGRVPAQDVAPHFRVPRKDASFVLTLRDDVANDRLAAMIDEVEPSFPLYARLERALAHYRMLAAQPTISLPPLPAQQKKVVPGDRYSGVPLLRDLLVQSGDLPSEVEAPIDDRYSDALAAAVAKFQRRHGLAPDGVIGRQTIAALAVQPAVRVRQIELSLERLRWLPDLPRGALIAINIPSFRLWAFTDGRAGERATLSMPVIVGKAMRGETPMFIGAMRYVEFSPYWNVPPTILRNELLPRLARDPSLLERDDMEAVGASGRGPVMTTTDDGVLAGLRDGELRLRQRPGPKNALGGVKFVLPNTMDIYLHATPARELFERNRRDFSHGCIRVGDPAALARFVLRDQPQWSEQRIEAAMTSEANRVVPLSAPIPVIVFYTTAIVDANGEALFLPDVYGHDRRLERALARHDPRR
jgi:murein L,D-transpeptidase YcbB/YkuD